MTPMFGPISSTAAPDTDLVTMTTTLTGQGDDSNMLIGLKYLENSWRCYLATNQQSRIPLLDSLL